MASISGGCSLLIRRQKAGIHQSKQRHFYSIASTVQESPYRYGIDVCRYERQIGYQVRRYIKPRISIRVPVLPSTDNESNGTQLSKKEELIDYPHPLDPHIQTCLPQPPSSTPVPAPVGDTGFNVSFLGTGGGIPTKHRLCSATVLRMGRQSLLFDAAEGIQRQLMHTRILLNSVTRIFITHLHADHVLGLPGLLLGLQLVSQNRGKRAALLADEKKNKHQNNNTGLTVELYGPPGLYNYVAMSLSLTMTGSSAGEIIVHELVGGYADPGGSKEKKNSNERRDPKHCHYREIGRRNLSRKTIAANADGTWTLVTPPAPSSAGRNHTKRQGNNVTVSAAEVQHVNGVMTFGYVVEEEEPQRNMDVKKAKACGVKPGRKYKLLKSGIPVKADDGSRMVQPEEVFEEKKTKKGRKLALIGDNCRLSPALYKLSQDCDVLVHEATIFVDEDDADSKESMEFLSRDRGHASAAMAGRVARDVNAKVLVLNHISSKIPEEALPQVVRAAERAATDKDGEATSAVLVSHDFLELLVPSAGFDDSVLVREAGCDSNSADLES